jgi:hypothetical protein
MVFAQTRHALHTAQMFAVRCLSNLWVPPTVSIPSGSAPSVGAINQALGRLPHSLQVPLLGSMQGHPAHVIAEDFGFSESTARRGIQEARDSVRDELAPHEDDVAEVPYETVSDPVLERSQRLFEETFAPSLGPEPGRDRDR